jgi:nitrate reductase gamma subunit
MSWLTPASALRLIPFGIAALLLIVGLAGGLTIAWGYGLFLVATTLILIGCGVFAVFMLSHRFDGDALRGNFTWLFRLGGWSYMLAIAAFSGFFVRETFEGRMEIKWILFGPAVLAAIVALDLGIYRLLVRNNLPTWQRFGHLVSRKQSDPEAMRRTLVDDVVLHRTLFSVSGFRWLKHTLIFWGFVAMFAIEGAAVVVRDAMPAFGFADVWREPGHAVRLAFDVAYDLTGLMVMVGCLLAIGWRVVVSGTPEQKFTDTPTAVFLLFVIVSGFVAEGLRIAATPDPVHAFSFVGYVFAAVTPAAMSGSAAAYDAFWLIHVLGSCAFLAYVPAKRLIHSCATPMGRLMNSQKGLLDAKKRASLEGLLRGKTF